MPKKYTAIDLFSGCGGLTEGLRQAGFRVLGAVEFDEIAAKTYAHNHPRVKLWKEDIRKVPAKKVMEKLGLKKGNLDLLAGCPPCQGFSSLRTLNGKIKIRDSQNNLIKEFTRFVRCFLPKVIILENVPSLKDDYRFKAFQSSLRKNGYKFTKYYVINAASYGVPQRRRRLILLASKKADIDLPETSTNIITVKQAIGHLPLQGKSGDPLHDLIENRTKKIKELIKNIPKNGGSRKDLGIRKQLKCHKNTDGFNDVYGRMSWDLPAPTITSGCFNPSKGRFLHPTKNRTITLREAALIQSFPDKYYISTEKGKCAAALMIGNAIPPELIRKKALKIKDYLKEYY